MIKNAPKLIPYRNTETEISFYLAVSQTENTDYLITN